MENKEDYNKMANKLIKIEDKFLEIKNIAKTIDIWTKEHDYELIPMMNMLNNKIKCLSQIIKE